MPLELGCDLLENTYLCGSNNNQEGEYLSTTCCDLLENTYLCGSNNNRIFIVNICILL